LQNNIPSEVPHRFHFVTSAAMAWAMRIALTYKTPKPRAKYIDLLNGSAKLTKN
jgi:hypothetical protein